MAQESKIIVPTRDNTFTALAAKYKLTVNSFKRAIDSLMPLIRRKNNRTVLSPKMVNIIVDYLGEPSPEFTGGIDPLRYRTNIKLAELYHVHEMTFAKWLIEEWNDDPNFPYITRRNKRFYTPAEVKKIVDKLDAP